MDQRGDLEGSFEEPIIKGKVKAAIGKVRRSGKSKGRQKSKGKQEVGLKLGKQQSNAQSNSRNSAAGNDFLGNSGMQEQEEGPGGALMMLAKKRLTSACATANRPR